MNSDTPLFREEAVATQHDLRMGTISLAAPVSFGYWSTMALVVTSAIVSLLIFGTYTRRETISGQLLPTAGSITLTSQTTGVVIRTLVHEGDAITEGQALAEISGDLESATMGSAHALISAQLHAQKMHLVSMLSSVQEQANAQKHDIDARIAILHEQLKTINEQVLLQRQVAAASARRLEQIKPALQEGYISKIQIEQYQAAALSDQVQIKVSMRQILDTQQQLSSLMAQLTQLPLETSTKMSQIQGQLEQLDAQLAENEAVRKLVLRAPHAGNISNVLFVQGQNVSAGQPLLSILPKKSELEAQLLIPSSAIGFIKVGNPVILRYQAYPYQKFGVHYGQVRQVSSSALNHVEAKTLLGREAAEPFYRVIVGLRQQTISVNGKAEALRPGMALNADILLEQRPLWQWMFDPVYGLH